MNRSTPDPESREAKSGRSGRDALACHAPEQAPVLEALASAPWSDLRARALDPLFDRARLAIAGQHRLAALPRPASLGESPWTLETAAAWRSDDGVDERARAALAMAEQIAFDVASVQPEHREAFFAALGEHAVPFAQALFAADLLPRARAALDACFGASDWQADAPSKGTLQTAVDELIRVVPALQSIDPVTTELVRLLGARHHACRVCQSVRSHSAMAAGADDATFDAVDGWAQSDLDPATKAALAFSEGMLASPARFDAEGVAALRRHFTPEARVELVLDLLRNATNKVAVALGGDAPRVETGYEVYDVKPDGEIVYGLSKPEPVGSTATA